MTREYHARQIEAARKQWANAAPDYREEAQRQYDATRTSAMRDLIGTTVHHFTNRESTATVMDIVPPSNCGGSYGFGNWSPDGTAFGPGAFILVLRHHGNGKTERDFASYWLPND